MKKLELPQAITNMAEAQVFLDLLQKNGLTYHPEDDATDCLKGLVSQQQAEQINTLMDQIYCLNENQRLPETFDPCEYIINKY